MNQSAIFTSIYTITPTHCGTGQTSGAVDLPVARESHTGLPIMPATALKGVARRRAKGSGTGSDNDSNLLQWFGSDMGDAPSSQTRDEGRPGGKETQQGALVFTEGKLLAYPVRSLDGFFHYVTSPLILQRLARDLTCFGLAQSWSDLVKNCERVAQAGSLPKTSRSSNAQSLVLEDLVFLNPHKDEVLKDLAKALKALLPPQESLAQNILENAFTLVHDQDLQDLITRCLPVQARVALTEGKTVDQWEDPLTEQRQTGNLWFEEHLPPDCWFYNIVGSRFANDQGSEALNTFSKGAWWSQPTQIGGNETVGMGLCWWYHPSQKGAQP